MTRKKMTRQQSKEQALEAYIENMELAREALARITAYLDDNGEIGPDDVNWSHTGSMAHIANQLTEIKDQIDGTGEYSE